MSGLEIVFYDKKLFKMFKKARDYGLDLRPVFKEIQLSWYKGNKAIFDLKSAGKYADLSFDYKFDKAKKYGFVYPILRASGALEKSLTVLDSVNAINKQYMIVGTSVDYAGFLQSGTRYMPARPPVLMGPEIVAPAPIKKRQELWVKMIRDYIKMSLQFTGN